MTTLNGVADFTIKQNDLLPTMVITCLNGTTPVDLTTASLVKIKGRMEGATTSAIDYTVTGNAQGQVTLVWSGTDTATSGRMYVEVEATFAGKKQTFPANGYNLVQIVADLG